MINMPIEIESDAHFCVVSPVRLGLAVVVVWGVTQRRTKDPNRGSPSLLMRGGKAFCLRHYTQL